MRTVGIEGEEAVEDLVLECDPVLGPAPQVARLERRGQGSRGRARMGNRLQSERVAAGALCCGYGRVEQVGPAAQLACLPHERPFLDGSVSVVPCTMRAA